MWKNPSNIFDEEELTVIMSVVWLTVFEFQCACDSIGYRITRALRIGAVGWYTSVTELSVINNFPIITELPDLWNFYPHEQFVVCAILKCALPNQMVVIICE